jgi:hypothetical protein
MRRELSIYILVLTVIFCLPSVYGEDCKPFKDSKHYLVCKNGLWEIIKKDGAVVIAEARWKEKGVVSKVTLKPEGGDGCGIVIKSGMWVETENIQNEEMCLTILKLPEGEFKKWVRERLP